MQSKRHVLTRVATATVLTACGMLIMTGCANPIEQLISKGTESALEKAIEQGGGGGVNLDLSEDGGLSFETEEGGSVNLGSSASVPDDWPGLPLPHGELVSAITQEGTFALTYRATVSEAESLLAALISAGYSEKSSNDMGAMKMHMLEGTDWDVNLTWIIDENTDEANVQYMLHPVA